MQIESLRVIKNYPKIETIREVKFLKNGMNFIVDKSEKKIEESGNDVGKTTAVKIIDLCLGAKSPNILYKNNDTGNETKLIKDFIEEYKVSAELVLKTNKEDIVLLRELHSKGKMYINAEEKSAKNFRIELSKLLFELDYEKPSFRDLITKFVRINPAQDEKIIYYLVSKDNYKYDSIYKFLFRFQDIDIINKLDNFYDELKELNKEIKFYDNNTEIGTLSILIQKLEAQKSNLVELEKEREQLQYIEKYKGDILKSNDLASKAKIISKNLNSLQYEIDMLKESIINLNRENLNIDSKELSNLYEETKLYVESVNIKYDELLNFHNKMVKNQLSFISKRLEKKEQEKVVLKKQLDSILSEKEKITISLAEQEYYNKLHELHKQIEEVNRKIGEYEKAKTILSKAEGRREYIVENILKIEKGRNNEIINKNLILFNKYFKNFTKEIYNEQHIIGYDSKWKEGKSKKNKPLKFESLTTNTGSGKTKGLSIIFDLAYIMFARELGLKIPEFIIYDKNEVTDKKQLKKIFNLTNKCGVQFILPILNEKLDVFEESEIKERKRLELSKNDKFFKLP